MRPERGTSKGGDVKSWNWREIFDRRFDVLISRAQYPDGVFGSEEASARRGC